MPKRTALLALITAGLVGALIAAGLLTLAPSARALPPAGTDTLNVSAEVTIVSRLGQETIQFVGLVTIQRDEPRMDGGVEVVDAEIVSLDLEGESVTGAVAVSQSEDFPSIGEIRSLQAPPDQFPASSFFDAFVDVRQPVSGPSNRSPAVVSNEDPLHLVPTSSLSAWPPVGAKYEAEPEAPAGSHCDPTSAPPPPPGGHPPPGGLALLPALPAELCVTSVSITMGDLKVPTATLTPCPAEVCPPTATATITPTRTVTPTATPTLPPLPENPSFSLAPGGPSGAHPGDLFSLSAGLPPPTATAVSGNDDFEDAWQITSLPFIGGQSTSLMTTEDDEPVNPDGCIDVQPKSMGHTAWYRLTAPATGNLHADTVGSTFDTVLAAYTGSSLGALTPVACNDDAGGLQSEINFAVTSGTAYRIQVGGFASNGGNLVLNISMAGGGGAGVPVARIPCVNLGLIGCGGPGAQDDIDALSFGNQFSANGDADIAFSVAPGSLGVVGSAVAQQVACSPSQAQADEFNSALNGTNTLFYDGDGLNGSCPTTEISLGLTEVPASDDLDALNDEPLSYVDGNGDSILDEAVFFSLAAGSRHLTAFTRSPADILWTVGFQPGVYASAATLGLRAGDDIDALCLVDKGTSVIYNPAIDGILFSLAAGSPTLAELGASPADILAPGPTVFLEAEDLGLRAADDLDAMKCFSGIEPPHPPTPTPTPVPLLGDTNCNGVVNSIDATLVLQLVAGFLNSVACEENADANRNGIINAIDATIILQIDAGLFHPP